MFCVFKHDWIELHSVLCDGSFMPTAETSPVTSSHIQSFLGYVIINKCYLMQHDMKD